MHAMMRHGSRGIIAAMLAVVAVLLLIGLAIAVAGGDDDGGSANGVVTTTTATAVPSATGQPTTAIPTATATLPPDTSVSSPPTSGTSAPLLTPTPNPPSGMTTLPINNLASLPAGTHRVDAPIDELSMSIAESYPPQYFLHIKAGLPSGCAKAAGYEASRSGNVITVKVANSMPDGAPVCTMIYGMYDLNINLGSDYVSGQEYTVNVNDKTVTFTAQ